MKLSEDKSNEKDKDIDHPAACDTDRSFPGNARVVYRYVCGNEVHSDGAYERQFHFPRIQFLGNDSGHRSPDNRIRRQDILRFPLFIRVHGRSGVFPGQETPYAGNQGAGNY